MTPAEQKLKHLEMIQSNIARMAQNSFSYKATSVTLVSAMFALAAATEVPFVLLVALIPTFAFWGLDTFHLLAERRFRNLYQNVIKSDVTDFLMTPPIGTTPMRDYLKLLFSKTLFPLYGLLIIIETLVFVVVTHSFNGDDCAPASFFQLPLLT